MVVLSRFRFGGKSNSLSLLLSTGRSVGRRRRSCSLTETCFFFVLGWKKRPGTSSIHTVCRRHIMDDGHVVDFSPSPRYYVDEVFASQPVGQPPTQPGMMMYDDGRIGSSTPSSSHSTTHRPDHTTENERCSNSDKNDCIGDSQILT